ncbi:hypothetical protein BDV19DRAFT_32911 [Aspergillus venezuelensis]
MLSTKRHRRYGKRSLKGCRTCRSRHVKCDETPSVCNNCKSTGRKCDGYDLHRLPIRRSPLTLTLAQSIHPHPGWVTTADEQRSFSYFQHCSIPGLGAFFDSAIWQKVILQISQVDRAVYHAANMLAALQEDSGASEMRLAGEDLQRACHRFALDQASRSYTHLAQRQASNDPQFRQVALICCLLFVLAELLLGRYASAFQHLHSGLRVLKETQDSHHHIRLDASLIQTFERLDIESAHFGPGTPFLSTHFGSSHDLQIQQIFANVQSVSDIHWSVTVLLNLGIPFLARCWPLSTAEIAAEYNDLFQKQQYFLSLNYQFQHHFRIFHQSFYHTLTAREQQGVDVLQLQSLGQILSLKTCLFRQGVPENLTPDYANLLSAHQSLLAKFPNRPTFILDYGVTPGLFVVASQCPDYSIRLRAIQTLQIWPHCEGFINSNVAVSVALQKLKAELRSLGKPACSIIDAGIEAELSRFLVETVNSTQRIRNWSIIRQLVDYPSSPAETGSLAHYP